MMICAMARGFCFACFAQRIASVRNADRILLLENGTIAAEGRHEELLKTSPLYRDIYASQQHSTEVM